MLMYAYISITGVIKAPEFVLSNNGASNMTSMNNSKISSGRQRPMRQASINVDNLSFIKVDYPFK